ncbi:MFS transporter [Nocardiopsis metallicus]|uniref:MFS family permease n=1 Tax=Nocardiopsis metallicus TaxID=179819 RepID=A0A840W0J3_9ACTN|nr:MFS transporter [Nocardiopsis metallicus]MBB5490320.1 MFS family permease [Nocardiopsis metallicus]
MTQRHALPRYLFGAAAARTGDEMSGPALLLLGVAATGTATTGSTLLAAVTATAAVGGPAVGVLLDRALRPGRVLATVLAVYAAGLAAVALLLDRLPLAPVLALALGIGLLGPALSGGWTAQLPRLLPPARMTRANAWDAMTFSSASLIGPALAGAVAITAGATAAVVASVALVSLTIPVAWSLPARPARPEPAPVLGELAAGARAVLGNRALLRATVVTTVSIAGTGVLVVSLPVLGQNLLGGPERGAMLLSVMAVSALSANLVLARHPLPVRPDTVVLVCVLLQVAGVAGVFLAPSAPWLILAATVVGTAEGPQLTSLFAVRHREAPERLRTQVFTTAASLKVSAFAAGAALAGPLADFSLPLCLAAAAALQLCAALVHAAVRSTSSPSPAHGSGADR